MATTQNTKRKDKARVVLRKGESQRKDGKCDFRWTSPDGNLKTLTASSHTEKNLKNKTTEAYANSYAKRYNSCKGLCRDVNWKGKIKISGVE